MPRVDLRPIKQNMREQVKQRRLSIPDEKKAKADQRIAQRLKRLREYQACSLVLTYVSKPIEVDTHGFIRFALEDGKCLAAPCCMRDSRMQFYSFTDMAQLEKRTFGVLEPDIQRCGLVLPEHMDGSICIVPALMYDLSGFRLGYGGGYYDRFLATYGGLKVGIIYEKDLRRRLWHGRYDVPVDLIVTEKRIINCAALPAGAENK